MAVASMKVPSSGRTLEEIAFPPQTVLIGS